MCLLLKPVPMTVRGKSQFMTIHKLFRDTIYDSDYRLNNKPLLQYPGQFDQRQIKSSGATERLSQSARGLSSITGRSDLQVFNPESITRFHEAKLCIFRDVAINYGRARIVGNVCLTQHTSMEVIELKHTIMSAPGWTFCPQRII